MLVANFLLHIAALCLRQPEEERVKKRKGRTEQKGSDRKQINVVDERKGRKVNTVSKE